MYDDAVELQRLFLSQRDKLCKDGERFVSPALVIIKRHLSQELDEERKTKAEAEAKEDAKQQATQQTQVISKDMFDLWPFRIRFSLLKTFVLEGVTFGGCLTCRAGIFGGRGEWALVFTRVSFASVTCSALPNLSLPLKSKMMTIHRKSPKKNYLAPCCLKNRRIRLMKTTDYWKHNWLG